MPWVALTTEQSHDIGFWDLRPGETLYRLMLPQRSGIEERNDKAYSNGFLYRNCAS